MKCVISILVLQLLTQCRSRGTPEGSVVSYQKSGTGSGDVYLQIATNIAEKLTTPIYSFFGVGRNRTGSIFKKRWSSIETLDESKEVNDLKPFVNDLEERDIEQLSLDTLQTEFRKPEKIHVFPKEVQLGKFKNIQLNDSYNEVDSKELMDDGDDDNIDEKAKSGGFIYFIELAGSFLQLIFGAILQLFKPPSS